MEPIRNVLAGLWWDAGRTKPTRFLSTWHHDKVTTVLRRMRGHVGRVEVNAPVALADYNVAVRGVDTANHRRQALTVQRRTRKWWKALFAFWFDSAVTNAFLLYEQTFSRSLLQSDFQPGVPGRGITTVTVADDVAVAATAVSSSRTTLAR